MRDWEEKRYARDTYIIHTLNPTGYVGGLFPIRCSKFVTIFSFIRDKVTGGGRGAGA